MEMCQATSQKVYEFECEYNSPVKKTHGICNILQCLMTLNGYIGLCIHQILSKYFQYNTENWNLYLNIIIFSFEVRESETPLKNLINNRAM